MGNMLLDGIFDDAGVIDHLFLLEVLTKHLSEREHAVLALRMSGYTRATIVDLLGLGKTTVYTCERQALTKLRQSFIEENEQGETEWNQPTGTIV